MDNKKNNILLLFLLLFTTILFQEKLCFANSNINVNPSENIPAYQTQYVVNAVKMTMDYMNTNFNRSLEKNININIVSNENASTLFSYNDEANNVGGKTIDNNINLIINPTSTEYYITFLTAHELVHQYQIDCFGSIKTLNKNMWFVEGMADVLGEKIAAPLNPKMEDKFRKNAISNSLTYPINLTSITTKSDWKTAFNNKEKTYAKADLALLYLTDKYNITLLFVYFNNLYNVSASQALKNTYNIDIDKLENIIMGNDTNNNTNNDDLKNYLDL